MGRSRSGAIACSVENLAPHRPETPTMETQLSKYEYVYYASYGSNLDRARFTIYLRGGSPDGSDRVYPPNEGGTESPEDDVFFTSEHWRVTFAGRSTTWLWDPGDPDSGGGMAFLMPREGGSPAPPARFRAYRIKRQQFVGVVRAENTRRTEMDKGDLSKVPELEAVNLSPEQDLESLKKEERSYARLVWVGMLGDWPVLTFTCSRLPDPNPNPPTPEYVGTILSGLLHTHLRDESAILRDPWFVDWTFPLPRSRRVVVRESR
jgi:hypothetical protein